AVVLKSRSSKPMGLSSARNGVGRVRSSSAVVPAITASRPMYSRMGLEFCAGGAAAADHHPHIGLLEEDGAEAWTEAPQGRPLQINLQAFESQQRLAVRVGQRQLGQLEIEREGIEADVAERERAPVVIVNETLEVLACEVRHAEEARRR